MGLPVDLDDELTVKQNEIRDVLEACEEVLTAVAFAECCYCRLDGLFGLCHICQKEVGGSEEIHPVSFHVPTASSWYALSLARMPPEGDSRTTPDAGT